MRQRRFEALREARWQRFEALLSLAPPSGLGWRRRPRTAHERGADESEFPALYRSLCRDLAIANERSYSPALVDRLDRLVLAGHRRLYRGDLDFGGAVLRFLARGFPRRIRTEARFVAWGTGLFFGPGLLVALAIAYQPELVYSVLPAESVREFESMYDPRRARTGTLRDAGSDVYMFGFYILNNIGIAFRTFAGGILLCLGSAFMLVYNGLVLGGITAHIVHLEYGATFFPFVIGHGAFELTAIAIAGAAGLKLGWALWAPGAAPRLQALRTAARGAVELVYGAGAMLLVAAFLEAFWSSKSALGVWPRIGVGALLWALILGYFAFAGRQHEASASGSRRGA